MEKIIRNVMMNHLTFNKLLASEQREFVNSKNCCSNLKENFDFITREIEDGNNIDITFLNFAKAFDSVSLSKLCCKLYGYGFHSYILQRCKTFLSNRKQELLCVNDTKIMSAITNESNSNVLQKDLNKLLDWSNKCLITFNGDMCKVMHIGKLNPQFNYKLENHVLQKTENERDLGVIISNDLK
ncbi:uncharacterized protein LOC136087041 [Hydra vulgaris]|uniref:Uncharacterized protein LOC136087041 n=1 Tax=Hydra vulgaris TaxID=6087 RepID=A0ABM4CUN6_HYDVU